ncbi:MAG: hypothetical protein HYZ47_01795 [Simkania negevensis]|nr:hypothetical protein [Simkania negevensis]
MASPSRPPQGGALASWDRRMIQLGYRWAQNASTYPCYTLFLSTAVAFLILKGTKNLHTSLPRSIRREALHIGIWSAQLVFFGTPLLMFAHHASRRVLKAIADLPQNRQQEGKEEHTDDRMEGRRDSLTSSLSSVPEDP